MSDKTAARYAGIFARLGASGARGMMVGNSMRSDIRPMIEAGGWGVFVPHDLAWDLEQADPPDGAALYRQLDSLGALPALVAEIEGG